MVTGFSSRFMSPEFVLSSVLGAWLVPITSQLLSIDCGAIRRQSIWAWPPRVHPVPGASSTSGGKYTHLDASSACQACAQIHLVLAPCSAS